MNDRKEITPFTYNLWLSVLLTILRQKKFTKEEFLKLKEAKKES